MATATEWATGYARQADADFRTFEILQTMPVPECHTLQFLQMACEKLVKAYRCDEGVDPETLLKSHACVAGTLPVVLRQQAVFVNFKGAHAKWVMQHAKHLAQEIELLAPAVKRGGQRPDNCEYPWEDAAANLYTPLNWPFIPTQLLVIPAGRSFLKLVRGAIDGLLPSLGP